MKLSTPLQRSLVVSATLALSACGRSHSPKAMAPAVENSMVPQGFTNTVKADEMVDKNSEMKALVQKVERSFGVSMQAADLEETPNLSSEALQAFTGQKADRHLLSRSLEAEAAITLITGLLTEKPSTCSAAVVSVESLYAVLTASTAQAIAHIDQASLQEKAKKLGLTLQSQTPEPSEALSFHMTGQRQLGKATIQQDLDLTAGANDRLIFVKRKSQWSSQISEKSADGTMQPEWGRSKFSAEGGIVADLEQEQITLVDQRQAEVDVVREGLGIRGSSHLAIQNVASGGASPSVTTDVTMDLQGNGLIDEVGFPLYSEHRHFTSTLVKVDSNTMRFTLSMATQGVRGKKEGSVQWVLQKAEDGSCAVSRLGH